MTRVTLFAFRQRVQTATFLGVPLTRTRIFWTFALKRRRVRRWEWEMVFPNPGVFPQISHTEAITPGRVPQRMALQGRGGSAAFFRPLPDGLIYAE